MSDRAVKRKPTPDELRALLDYNPATGKFIWRHRGQPRFDTQFAGKEAFTHTDSAGSKVAKVLEHPYKAHRVAWAMHYGEWPTLGIDHINGVRDDNRIANLREVDQAENNRNRGRFASSSAPRLGVFPAGKKWRATIKHNDKSYCLGTYAKLEDAIAAREAGERRFGFHENHGREAA